MMAALAGGLMMLLKVGYGAATAVASSPTTWKYNRFARYFGVLPQFRRGDNFEQSVKNRVVATLQKGRHPVSAESRKALRRAKMSLLTANIKYKTGRFTDLAVKTAKAAVASAEAAIVS